jgi:arabinofuranosyltransferase
MPNTGLTQKPSLAPYLLMAVVLIVFSVGTLRFVDKAQDDTYITLRYAENLVRGEGLVFNPGERVEGYSNFLYAVALAAGIAAGADPMVLAKSIGFAAGLATILITWHIAGALPYARRARILAPALLAITSPFAAWAVLGLETLMYSLLMVIAVTVLVSHDGGRRAAWAGVAFALLALTRPEGALFFVAAVGFLFAVGQRRLVVRLIPPFVIFVGAFAVWRVWYYGDVLPNTYYAKSGLGPLALVRGAKYVFEFFKVHGGPVIPALAVVPLFWGAHSRHVNLIASLCVAYLIFVVQVGGDNFAEFRFIAPILPLVYLLVGDGLVRAFDELRRPVRTWTMTRAAPVAALVIFSTVFAVAPMAYVYAPGLRNVAVDAPLTDAYQLVTIGTWLRGIAPPDSTIAVGEAGAVPYTTGWRTLDAFGLSDPVIAHAPRVPNALGARKKSAHFIINRVLEWRPHFVEFYASPGFDTVLGPNDDLLWKALLAAGYVPVPPYAVVPGFVVLARADVATRLMPRASRH